MSIFTELVCEALAGGGAFDLERSGFVTMSDVHRHVARGLAKRTSQSEWHRFDGSNDLAVALGHDYPPEVDWDRPWATRPSGQKVQVPAIVGASTADEVERNFDGAAHSDKAVTAESDRVPNGQGAQESNQQGEAELPDGVGQQFETAISDDLQDGREMALRRRLQGIARDAIRLSEPTGSWSGFETVLDRLTCMTAVFLNHRSTDWFKQAVAALVRVYEQGFDSQGLTKNGASIAGEATPSELWVAILQRLDALGALAIRNESWGEAVALATQRPDGYDFKHYTNWIRHSVTKGYQANLFLLNVDGKPQKTSALVAGYEYAVANECLRPDLASLQEDRLLDSVCQFDALASTAAIARAGSFDSGCFYPSFGLFESDRSEPFFRKLLGSEAVRGVVAPDTADDDLYIILTGLSSRAAIEGAPYGGWSGFNAPAIRDWLDKVKATDPD